jgi:hypothetical protein
MPAEARERALASLERSARLQNQLINDLLDVSRISKGKLPLVLRVVDVGAAVSAAVESASHLAEAKNIRITAATPSANVCGDALRLQQVFTNLITNAVQFTPAGGKVDLDGDIGRGQVTIRVRDNGAGIEPAFLPFVFDKFRQAEQGLTRQHGGLGVGLSITHEVVALHGGAISAASEGPGRGAEFAVTLPLASPALEALQEQRPNRPVLADVRIALIGPPTPWRGRATGILEMAGASVHVADTIDQPASTCDVILAGPDTVTGDVAAARVAWLSASGHAEAVPPAMMVAQVAEAIQTRMHTAPR